MRKIGNWILALAIIASSVVVVVPFAVPQPVMAMSGNGTAENPYMISDVVDLQDMEDDLTAYYALANDIDASATATWNTVYYMGEWAPLTEYFANDHVEHGGVHYICHKAHTSGLTFHSMHWTNYGTDLGAVPFYLGFLPVGRRQDMQAKPISDISSTGTWAIYPSDGSAWNKTAEDVFNHDGDATYIEGQSDGATMTLACSPISLPGGYFINVGWYGAWKRTGTGGTVTPFIRMEGVDYPRSSAVTPSTSYSNTVYMMSNPKGGPWTAEDVALIEGFGVTVGKSSTGNIRISSLSLHITYSSFTGHLDGQGHTITNLYINREGDRLGLFSQGRGGATIVDLALASPTIISSSSRVGALIGDGSDVQIEDVNVTGATITGTGNVGGLAGEFTGNIIRCYTSGTVESTGSSTGGLIGSTFNSLITDCHTAVTVLGTGTQTGGLIGGGYGDTVTECSATGDVTGLQREVGGLIGEMEGGAITRCYATGDVVGNDYQVGGLIGEAEYTVVIEECYATGDVSSTHATPRRVGGLVGDLEGTIRNSYATGAVLAVDGDRIGGLAGDNDGGTIENSYSRGHVTGGTVEVGGLVGRNNGGVTTHSFWDIQTSGQATSDGGTGKTTAEMKNIAIFNTAGWDIAPVWISAPYRNDGYPVLSWPFGNSPTWYIHTEGFPDSIYQVVHFQPEAIISGTTLPNLAQGGGVHPDGVFSWGANPAGITTTLEDFAPEDVYYFEPITPGSWDIIEPETASIVGDTDLGRLANNPLRPLVQVLSSGDQITETLAWLLLAIFIVIAAMVATQLLGQHMVFTALVGFGLSTLFYSMGVWGLWVVILMVFGLVASIVYERMPTL